MFHTSIEVSVVWPPLVEIFFVLVHPNLSHALQILEQKQSNSPRSYFFYINIPFLSSFPPLPIRKEQTFCRCVPPWSRGRQPWCHRTARSGEEKYVIFHKTFMGNCGTFLTLNDSSYCSPPHILSPSSYPPNSQKNLELMAKRPPAITGLRNGLKGRKKYHFTVFLPF